MQCKLQTTIACLPASARGLYHRFLVYLLAPPGFATRRTTRVEAYYTCTVEYPGIIPAGQHSRRKPKYTQTLSEPSSRVTHSCIFVRDSTSNMSTLPDPVRSPAAAFRSVLAPPAPAPNAVEIERKPTSRRRPVTVTDSRS